MADPHLLVGVLAAGGHDDAGAATLPVAIGLAVLLLIILTRIRGRRLRPARLLIVPAVLLAAGLTAVLSALSAGTALHGIDYLLIAVDLTLSIGLGAARGGTVRIGLRNGEPWYRYGPVTVALWLLSIGLRFALGYLGARHGAAVLSTSSTVLLMLGLTLLTQNLIVLERRPTATGPAATP